MWRKLKSAMMLSPAQWRQFIEAWFLFCVWDIRIRNKKYESWRKYILNDEIENHGVAALQDVTSIIKISELAGRHHLVKVNCLRRCLTQRVLLSKRGIPTSIHFGVILNSGKVDAHYWLDWNGVIINDSYDVVDRYSELEQISSAALMSLMN